MPKDLNKLWEEYRDRYDGEPKHGYPYFVKVMSKIQHHRELIRPYIDFWSKG